MKTLIYERKKVMETKILKGNTLQEKVLTEVKNEIIELHKVYTKLPGIAFIGFLGVPLGKYNIPLHVQMAKGLGFHVLKEIKPEDVTEDELFELIEKLNKNKDIHAIVLLQPLPAHLNSVRITNRIDPDKEVEGFHPQNMLSTIMPDARESKYPMCLPTALYELFKNGGVQVRKDQEWVLVMDDEFFSNPFTNMIVRTALIKAVPKNCSVTIVNKNSDNLVEHCKRADYLVIVTKNTGYVQPDWLKPGVCIIDVYANLVKEIPSKKNPGKTVPIIRGGVNVESVKNIAGAILPIPGGLMSMVLALLFRNTLISFTNSIHAVSR
ncbi:MAG: hypothetical protein K8S16_08855 [Bacteroidales bacterium]|nr:hypothetical protein [Bacteroidales bacterium]